MSSHRDITPEPVIDHIIFCDASGLGWGAHDDCTTINGRWSDYESGMHINSLELLAIQLALFSFAISLKGKKHVRVMSDNATAIAYINKKGGVKSMVCNDIAKVIWGFCMENNFHISAAHIPGKHNILADLAFQKFQDASEWMLNSKVFGYLTKGFGMPELDLFASRLNKQIPTYVSWLPDPGSVAIDAMTIPWSGHYVYCFPPFSMMWPTIKKIERESDKALVICPCWPTQTWFARLLQLAIAPPIEISSRHLHLPGIRDRQLHPLAPKLRLLAVLCSRKVCAQNSFRLKHSTYLSQRGAITHNRNIAALERDGKGFVVLGTWIPLEQLPQM